MHPQRCFLGQERGSWINTVQFLQWKTFPPLSVGAVSKADTRGVQRPHHLITSENLGGICRIPRPAISPGTIFLVYGNFSPFPGICIRSCGAVSQAEERCSGQQTLHPCRAELILPVCLSIAQGFLKDRALPQCFLSA